jgi:hypothetical protein
MTDAPSSAPISSPIEPCQQFLSVVPRSGPHTMTPVTAVKNGRCMRSVSGTPARDDTPSRSALVVPRVVHGSLEGRRSPFLELGRSW